MKIKSVYVRSMRLAILSAVLSMAAQCQPGPALTDTTVSGVVKRFGPDFIDIATRGENVTVGISNSTEIWKGKVFHDSSPLAVGDTITARCRRGPSGSLIADSVWLNITNFFGNITELTKSGFAVFTNPDADPKSAYRQEIRAVEATPETVFEASARDDLRVGRGVQVVGVKLDSGAVRATKITVYQGKRPVRMRSDQRPVPASGR